ncbi:hypothetical protein [Microbacterium sp.]|uniref:hypothetical protein n=1 Tax=Microbacterium sp. TaxID=51671 RepID=UPI003242CEDD
MTDSPEDRRDAVIAEVVAAGGVVLATAPLATAEDPHTVAAYRLSLGSPDLTTRAALAAIRARTSSDLADLVDWTPAPEPEVLPEPEPEAEPVPLED